MVVIKFSCLYSVFLATSITVGALTYAHLALLFWTTLLMCCSRDMEIPDKPWHLKQIGLLSSIMENVVGLSIFNDRNEITSVHILSTLLCFSPSPTFCVRFVGYLSNRHTNLPEFGKIVGPSFGKQDKFVNNKTKHAHIYKTRAQLTTSVI